MKSVLVCVLLALITSCSSSEDYPIVYNYSHIQAGPGQFYQFSENENFTLVDPELYMNDDIYLTDEEQEKFVQELLDFTGPLFDRLELISEDELKFVRNTNGQIQEAVVKIEDAFGLNFALENSTLQVRQNGENSETMELDLLIYVAQSNQVTEPDEFQYILNYSEAWSILPYFHADSLRNIYEFKEDDVLAIYMPFMVFVE